MYQLTGIGDIAVFFGTLLVAIVLHEMMHAVVAYRLGDDLAHSHRRISFNPLNHIDPVLTLLMPLLFYVTTGTLILAAKPVPINTSRLRGEEYGFALVALAGPLTNLLLAILAGVTLQAVSPDGLVEAIVVQFIVINVGLCAFNLLPIPPLDGSRVLYAVAPEPVRNFMRSFEQFGLLGLIIIIFLLGGILYPILREMSGALLTVVDFFSGGRLAGL